MLASLASIASLLLLAFAVSLDGFGVGITYGIRQIRIPPRSIWIISCCSGLVILIAMLVGTLLVRWIPPHAASSVGAAILIGIGFWALIQFMRGRDSESERADDRTNEQTDNQKDEQLASEFDGMSANAASTKRSANVEPALAATTTAANTANTNGAESAIAITATVTNANATEPAIATAADVAAPQRTVWTLEIRQWGIVVQILRTPAAADMDRSGTITVGEAFLLGTALSLDAFGAGIGAAMVGFPPLVTSATIAAAGGLFLWMGTRVGFRVAGWRWVRPLTVLPGIILIAMGLLKLF